MEYPEMITDLPEADIPFKGVRGWLMQGENQQIVFMDIAPIGGIPEHSHGAQFGVVLDGELTLTIDGETRLYQKGDSYFIPANAPHSATISDRVKVMDMFADANRYKPM